MITKENMISEGASKAKPIDDSSPTVANFMSGLKTLLDDMQKSVQAWKKERGSVLDGEDRLILDADTRIKAIRIIEKLDAERKEPNELILNVHDRLREIAMYDRFLATEISKVIGWQGEKDNIPARALTVLAKYDNDRIFQHFSKYYSYYYERIRTSGNTYIARWSTVLIDYFLSNYRRRNEIIKQISDNKSEAANLLSQYGNVQATVQGVKLIVEKLDRIMGQDLKKLSSSAPALNIAPIHHLISHPEEIGYLWEIVRKIERGMTEGMWEEFKEVQKGAEKEIPSLMETEYGDYETAELFRQWSKPGKGGLHDYPMIWSKEIRKRISALRGNWPFIFSQGLKTFYLLCQKCQIEVQNRFEPEFKRIKEKAGQLIKKKEKEPKNTAKTILKITKKEKDEIEKEMDKARRPILAAEKEMMIKVNEFWEAVDHFLEESGSQELLQYSSDAQQKMIQGAAISAELARRIGGYGVAYDISLGAQLIARVADVRAREDGLVERSSLIAYSILRYGIGIVEKKLNAEEAINAGLQILERLKGGVKNG